MLRIQSLFVFALFFIFNYVHAQTVTIDSAARELERQRWNEALTKDTSYHFNKEPNLFLQNAIKGIKPGTAVDIGMGQGRNAIYLAQMGWDVTGFDIADEALAVANANAQRKKVKIKTVQQGSEEFDFGDNQWDLVSFIYSGCMEDINGLSQRIKKGIRPGGLLVFEFCHRDAGVEMNRFDFGCPTNLEKQILLKIGGFEIISYQEVVDKCDYGLEPYKLVRMIAKRI